MNAFVKPSTICPIEIKAKGLWQKIKAEINNPQNFAIELWNGSSKVNALHSPIAHNLIAGIELGCTSHSHCVEAAFRLLTEVEPENGMPYPYGCANEEFSKLLTKSWDELFTKIVVASEN